MRLNGMLQFNVTRGMRWVIAILTGFSIVLGNGMVLSAQPAAPASPQDPYYARYETPGMCEQAARRMIGFATRAWHPPAEPDTVMYSPVSDSTPSLAVRTARACAARFNVATVPERELLNLAQLYLLGNQEQLAQAAIARLLAVKGSMPAVEPSTRAVERGWVFWMLSGSLRDTGPTRLAQSEQYLQQLDSLGAPVALWRLLAHSDQAEYLTRLNDLPAAIAEAHAAIQAVSHMVATDQLDFRLDLIRAYERFADPTDFQARLAAPALLKASVAAADTAIRTLNNRTVAALTATWPAGWPRELEYVARRLKSMGSDALRGPAAPIRAEFWYNTAGDTVARPRLGEVTLVVFVAPTCGGWCYGNATILKRLHAKYAALGLRFLIVDETVGWFRTQLVGPLGGDRARELAKEAELRRGYLLDFLNLPGVLAIEATEYTRMADGRRKNNPSLSRQDYPRPRGRGAFLIDKSGMIRLTMEGLENPYRERVVDAVIRTALR